MCRCAGEVGDEGGALCSVIGSVCSPRLSSIRALCVYGKRPPREND